MLGNILKVCAENMNVKKKSINVQNTECIASKTVMNVVKTSPNSLFCVLKTEMDMRASQK